jgi:hypothetical protein
MGELYPEIEPYAHGFLDVGHSNRIYWEECGNPHGKPVQAPIANAWILHRAWPGSELIIVDNAGHGSGMASAIIDATDKFAQDHLA